MFLEFILPFSLILPGLWILQMVKIKVHNIFDLLSISYILSLSSMLILLYISSIIKIFNIISLIFLAVVFVSFFLLLKSVIIKISRLSRSYYINLFSHIFKDELVVVIPAIGLLFIYVIFLNSRALLDSDVTQYYLPIAREIVRENGFAYNNGYGYNIYLKPIGVSILYAWTYVVSGSTLSEAFRLMPLVPIIMLIILNYAIATVATQSKTISLISTALFLVFPFHDRFLLYNAFYPDTFYYTLIFITIYFFLKYLKSQQNSLIFWTGAGFGIASLFKAQTIYFLIAFILVFFLLKLRIFKILSMSLCFFTPFYIIVLKIIVDSIQSTGFHLSIPIFTNIQWRSFLFLSTLPCICYYVIIHRDGTNAHIQKISISNLIKETILLTLPLILLSSIWYLNNLIRFRTLIWTSSLNLPNYEWAIEVLKSIETTQSTTNIWQCLIYYIFILFDPSVMGYILFIPMLIGLYSVLKNRLENLNFLILHGTISAVIILSSVIIFSTNGTSVYNPRDIFPLAPLLSTLSAIGIMFTTTNCFKTSYNSKGLFIPFLFIIYFGLLNYIHSVYVWYISSNSVTIIGKFASSFVNYWSLNLRQTSFQISSENRIMFLYNYILRIIAIALFASIPVLSIIIYRQYKHFTSDSVIKFISNTKVKKFLIKIPPISTLTNQGEFIKIILINTLMLSIIITPRIEMFFIQGGMQNIKENQLKSNFGDIYKLITSPINFNGEILTYKAPMGLPYYLPDVRFLDLNQPAILASLKDCLQSNSPIQSIIKLKERNIRYLLINPYITHDLDATLNFTISKISKNSDLVTLSHKFGNWKLYIINLNSSEEISSPISSWNMNVNYPKFLRAGLNFQSFDINAMTMIIKVDERCE